MSTIISKPGAGAGSNISRQSDPINVLVGTTETDLFLLNTASTIFVVEQLLLESTVLGVGVKITIRFYNKVDAVLKEISQFELNEFNYNDPQSLEDMFGQSLLAGSEVKVTAQSSIGSHTVTGQTTYSKTI